MKKVYSKPRIAVEDFIVQDSIAAGCSAKINFTTTSECSDTVVDGADENLQGQILGWANLGYFPDTDVCSKKYSGSDDESDEVCYFTAANNVFRS